MPPASKQNRSQSFLVTSSPSRLDYSIAFFIAGWIIRYNSRDKSIGKLVDSKLKDFTTHLPCGRRRGGHRAHRDFKGFFSVFSVVSVVKKVFKKQSLRRSMTISIEEKLRDIFCARGLKLATAESCTGGLVSDRITDIPGSSEYFIGGVVAYAYEAKANILGVSWDTLHAHGAVSGETVLEMARGARKLLEVDIAVSVSGIAGPGGGMPEKPVGLTWFGLSTKDGDWARHFIWDGDRIKNKHLSSEAALQFVLDYLEGNLK
jgi:PncC family amidohydrolase